jgi:hypothetical protein
VARFIGIVPVRLDEMRFDRVASWQFTMNVAFFHDPPPFAERKA